MTVTPQRDDGPMDEMVAAISRPVRWLLNRPRLMAIFCLAAVLLVLALLLTQPATCFGQPC